MKILRSIFLVLIITGLGGCFALRMAGEDKPTVNQTEKADLLAEKMLSALNKDAWDNLEFLSWEFMKGKKYVWDKQNNKVVITWKKNKVNLNLNNQKGRAYYNGEEVSGKDAEKLIKKAWSYWCNDSFWMFAPFKVFDPGTKRSIVEHKGKDALLVSYDSGGVTPGDSYLWILDDNNIPTAYKMWVSLIPVGGLQASWEDWIDLPCGAKLSTKHDTAIMGFSMKNIKEGKSWADFDIENPQF